MKKLVANVAILLKGLIISACALSWLGGFTTDGFAQSALPDPRVMKPAPLVFTPPALDTFTLSNGARVVFLPDHELPVAQITALFHGGSAYDQTTNAGLAEITAAALRSAGVGKRSGDQIDEDLDFLAASVSSVAEADRLTLSMRCLKKDFALVFDIFCAILISPQFDSARVGVEVSNKIDAIARQNDSPQDICRRIFNESLYGEHPYGMYPTAASVSGVSAAQCHAFHERYYTPGNCIFAISGDLTSSELRATLDKGFVEWKNRGSALVTPARANSSGTPGVYFAAKDVSQTTLRMGHLGCEFDSPDRFAVRVMNYALGVGFTSRLTGEVRSKAGLAYSVGSYFIARPLTGAFFAYCQTKSETTAQATQMIIDIIRGMRDSGMTTEEFQRSKDAILNSFVFEYESSQQIVASAAGDLFSGFPLDQTTRDLSALQAVTLADCNAVAKKYLAPEKFVIAAVGKSEAMDKPLSTFGPVSAVSLESK